MNKTKIEYADRTWNPITGCLHNCEYCYARGIARRFGGADAEDLPSEDKPEMFVANSQMRRHDKVMPYPFGFFPTLHRYRLDEPQAIKTPQTVFVGSMADMFGAWVPDEWIEAVLEACYAAQQHDYLFLTKNPQRYYTAQDMLPNSSESIYWFGASASTATVAHCHADILGHLRHPSFLSLEPLHEDLAECVRFECVDWVIIGAQTGNRKGKITPKREWVQNIVDACREADVPVFLKDNPAQIWQEPLIREYPWEG